MSLADWGERTARPRDMLSQMLAVSVRMPAAMPDVEGGMVLGTAVPASLQPPAVSWRLLRAQRPTLHSLHPPFVLFRPAFPSNGQPPPRDLVHSTYLYCLPVLWEGLCHCWRLLMMDLLSSMSSLAMLEYLSVPHQKLDGISIEIILNCSNNE